jgi:hypothetical protein
MMGFLFTNKRIRLVYVPRAFLFLINVKLVKHEEDQVGGKAAYDSACLMRKFGKILIRMVAIVVVGFGLLLETDTERSDFREVMMLLCPVSFRMFEINGWVNEIISSLLFCYIGLDEE